VGVLPGAGREGQGAHVHGQYRGAERRLPWPSEAARNYGAATVNCGARSAAGQYLFCSFNDPTIVGIAHSLAANSYIYFLVDAAGRCWYLDVEAQSYMQPVTP
jgi:hypothetical protein